jgi:glycosyltransferase involved in cell wall biosynthesis
MTKPLKQIKVIHVASGDRWAGAEAQVYTLLKTLNKMANVTVYAVILNDGELSKKLGDEGINTTILDETYLSSWKILGRLRSLFQEIQPDIIHTHRLKENVLASVANKLSTNAILVATIHGDSEFNYPIWKIHKRAPQWINWFFTRFLYKQLIAVSKDLGEKLTNSYPKKYIQIIENGIDIEAVQLAADSSHFEKDAEKRHHIGIAGRLEQVKRVDIFLDMARLLISSSPENEWCFHIFGDGSLENQLKDQARSTGITAHVSFHGHREDIASCLQAMDCLVMCSDHEGLPMAPLEALALKTPVVAHKTGGLIDILNDSTVDLLVSDHCPEGYAVAVSKLFSSSVAVEQLLERRYKKITLDFTAQSNALRCNDLYKNLMGDSCYPL